MLMCRNRHVRARHAPRQTVPFLIICLCCGRSILKGFPKEASTSSFKYFTLFHYIYNIYFTIYIYHYIYIYFTIYIYIFTIYIFFTLYIYFTIYIYFTLYIYIHIYSEIFHYIYNNIYIYVYRYLCGTKVNPGHFGKSTTNRSFFEECNLQAANPQV